MGKQAIALQTPLTEEAVRKLRAGDMVMLSGTMFTGRDEVHKYFKGQIFDTIVPRNIRLTEAPSHGRPIILYDLRSVGAVAYLELAREVLNRDHDE